MSEEIKNRSLFARVVSNKMDKTISVIIERRMKHPLYKKYIQRSTRLLAHDEKNECNEGDKVLIAECRPLSKHKSWRLIKIIDRAV